MTKAITRNVRGHEVAFLANAERTAFAISIDGHQYSAGSDRLEALAAFRLTLARYEVA